MFNTLRATVFKAVARFSAQGANMKEHVKHETEHDTKAKVETDAPVAPVAPVETHDVLSSAPTKTVILSATPQDAESHVSVEIPAADFGFRILVGGQMYEHVTESADGTWVFAPSK